MKKKIRQKGWEVEKKKRIVGVNQDKLENNLTRSKTTVNDLAICNEWDWWCTLTISPDKHDRSDLPEFRRKFGRWLTNKNRYLDNSDKISYLLVPEKHKDGNWHMHGFLKGNIDVAKNEHGYFDWYEYRDKFGFISLSKIKNQEKAASYITKYMTKDLQKSVSELGEHTYVATKGLKRPIAIKKGISNSNRYPSDWENEYVAISTITTKEQLSLANTMITWDGTGVNNDIKAVSYTHLTLPTSDLV